MIAHLIAWSARNLMLIMIGTAFAVGGGLYAVKHLPSMQFLISPIRR